MKTTVELITPEKAQVFLGKNLKNRKVKKGLYEGYADDMLNGRALWKENPNAGLMFDTDGILIDGQHRLWGVIDAANRDPQFEGIEMIVYRDVPKAIRHVTDIGSVRSIGDILTMEQHQHGGIAGAAAQLILNYVDGEERLNKKRTKPEKYDFTEEFPAIFSYAQLARSAGKFGRHAPLAAVLFLGTRSGELEEHAKRFGQGIADGAELPVGDPRLELRRQIANARGERGGVAGIDWAFAATAMAWNNFITGTQMSQTRLVKNADNTYKVPPVLGAPRPGGGLESLTDATLDPAALKLAEKVRRTFARFEDDEGDRAAH